MCIHCQLAVSGCRFDFDCSGDVDGADLGTLLTQWSETGCPCSTGDQEPLLSESVALAIQGDGMSLDAAIAILGFDSTEHFVAWGSQAPQDSLSAMAQSLRVLLATSIDGPSPD